MSRAIYSISVSCFDGLLGSKMGKSGRGVSAQDVDICVDILVILNMVLEQKSAVAKSTK